MADESADFSASYALKATLKNLAAAQVTGTYVGMAAQTVATDNLAMATARQTAANADGASLDTGGDGGRVMICAVFTCLPSGRWHVCSGRPVKNRTISLPRRPTIGLPDDFASATGTANAGYVDAQATDRRRDRAADGYFLVVKRPDPHTPRRVWTGDRLRDQPVRRVGRHAADGRALVLDRRGRLQRRGRRARSERADRLRHAVQGADLDARAHAVRLPRELLVRRPGCSSCCRHGVARRDRASCLTTPTPQRNGHHATRRRRVRPVPCRHVRIVVSLHHSDVTAVTPRLRPSCSTSRARTATRRSTARRRRS